ncbi:enoyl-CoA hydratase/isomerase family protein [Prauserella oleivorans]|uniref:Enoyl-CoA hydratase/isomerase family protein n=1 Tax=Prauserella oleivorans TaxID=1478153 RepID=A0ABW5WI16_9PSEU
MDTSALSSASLTVSTEGSVTVVRMHHGEDSRFHPLLLDALDGVLTSIEDGDEAGALVLTGTGKFFSNGLDLEYLGSHPDDAEATLARVHGLFARVLALPVPTVAAVNGHAFAAGAMLMLACDVAIMRADRGYVCLPESDLGLPFTPGMNALLTARLSPPVAHEAMVTGRRYPAAEAKAAGIVSEVAAEADVLGDAVARAASLAGKPRHALGQIKRDLYRSALDVLTGSTVGS